MRKPSTRIVFWATVVLLLSCRLAAFGQGNPIGLEELKSLLRGPSTPAEVMHAVEERGVNFVATEGVITKLRDEVEKNSRQFIPKFSSLVQAVRRRRPEQLLVGIARFIGEGKTPIDTKQLSINISHYLDLPDRPNRLIEFMILNQEIAGDGAAFDAGNEGGLDLVVWGEWQLLSAGKEIIHTRIRVITTYVSIEDTNARQDVALDSFAYSERLDLIESASVKTAQLVVVLAALGFYNQSNYQKAEALLQQLPVQDARVLFYRGNCRWREDKREEALELFKQAASADTRFLEARSNLGAVQFELGRLDDAIRNLELALRIGPDNDKVLDNLGAALIRKADTESGTDIDIYKKGLAQIERAKNINPHNATALYNYAEALTFGYQLPPLSALLAFNEYLMQNPGDHAVWIRCVDYWGRRTARDLDFEQARVFASLATEHDPHAGEYVEDLVAILGHPPFGEDTLRISQKLRSLATQQRTLKAGVSEGIFAIIVRSQVELGQFDEALKSFREAAINEAGVNGCAAHLSYRLAAGDIKVGQVQPELLKPYYAAVYESFFGDYLFGDERDRGVVFINFAKDKKRMLDIFDKILRARESSMGALVATGILHLQILSVPSKSKYWGLGGFLAAQEDPFEWAQRFRSEGRAALQKAANEASSITTRQYLKQCIVRINHVSLQTNF